MGRPSYSTPLVQLKRVNVGFYPRNSEKYKLHDAHLDTILSPIWVHSAKVCRTPHLPSKSSRFDRSLIPFMAVRDLGATPQNQTEQEPVLAQLEYAWDLEKYYKWKAERDNAVTSPLSEVPVACSSDSETECDAESTLSAWSSAWSTAASTSKTAEVLLASPKDPSLPLDVDNDSPVDTTPKVRMPAPMERVRELGSTALMGAYRVVCEDNRDIRGCARGGDKWQEYGRYARDLALLADEELKPTRLSISSQNIWPEAASPRNSSPGNNGSWGGEVDTVDVSLRRERATAAVDRPVRGTCRM
ncbi:hypothetical protein BKA93DRAFT_240254 [Sparassis latifolia]